MGNYLASTKFTSLSTDRPEFKNANIAVAERVNKLLAINGKQPVNEIHKKLGKIMWDFVGMGRNAKGLKKALKLIPEIREEFWSDAKVVGDTDNINIELEKAGRIADFMELAELLALDALHREESCGGHFREEYQTPEGEALRNDKKFAYVGAWEYTGNDKKPKLNKEQLTFEYVKPSERSYK
jgi:succinate dehydrogenase / fumarate reductase flavoprotein subunit